MEARFEVHDPAFRRLVPEHAVVELIATGFAFTEGPVWNGDHLLFSDIPNNRIVRYRRLPEGPEITTFRYPSGFPAGQPTRVEQMGSNGLTLDRQGRLLACEHGNRRVTRTEPDGSVIALADRYEGKRLNSPNDLVYRSDGTLFFTDPPFGLPEMADDPKRELPFSGVYRVRDGEVLLVTPELAGPNGLAFSPDERWLYVGNWDPDRKVVMRYDPETGEGDVLFDMTEARGEDAIDGLKVDERGNLYVCGPGGIWVVSSAGEHLGTLVLPEAPHNLAWGDAEGRGLYVTAETSVYRLRLPKGAT